MTERDLDPSLRRAQVKVEDHTLLLQLERTYDALEERVRSVEDIDRDRDFCDCDCASDELDDLDGSVEKLRTEMLEHVAVLRADLDAVRDDLTSLIYALRGGAGRNV